MANIIRIYWRAVEEYNYVIFAAAVLMVICQMVLLYLWVHLRNKQKAKHVY